MMVMLRFTLCSVTDCVTWQRAGQRAQLVGKLAIIERLSSMSRCVTGVVDLHCLLLQPDAK